jgi:hypothetical protein
MTCPRQQGCTGQASKAGTDDGDMLLCEQGNIDKK